MALTDDASSAPLDFYADFGPLGIYLAALWTGLLLYGSAGLLGNGRQYGLFRIALLGLFFSLSLTLEDELTFQFVELRNVALIAMLGIVPAVLGTGRSRQGDADLARLMLARTDTSVPQRSRG